jgi:hypothetical protein
MIVIPPKSGYDHVYMVQYPHFRILEFPCLMFLKTYEMLLSATRDCDHVSMYIALSFPHELGNEHG